MNAMLPFRIERVSVVPHELSLSYGKGDETVMFKTSCLKASRGQQYPSPAMSGSAKASCRQGSRSDRG